MHSVARSLCLLLLALSLPPQGSSAEDRVLHTFERQELTDTYYSEGANAGDINGDGQADVVYGPYWFAGPTFQEKHELYEAVPQNRKGYANNFFNWVYDFNADGRPDVFTVGFPGTPAHVYENPGPDGFDSHWPKHEVFDWVSNESPQLTNLVGDERPELVCTRDGFFGFASVNWDNPWETWEFHPISEQITAKRFGHGLGIGDVNGDGLPDIIHSQGWFEQPETHATDSRWLHHPVKFTNAYGGAEMYAYDVDGDGDNDVITSHAAHDFGLAWYEQISAEGEVQWKHHLIMGSHPSENRYGVLFSELHSVNLADLDGDGLKDIVTGKTYYSHHEQSPMWDAGAVVYWFKLVRSDDGVDWVPFQADGESGIGRQLSLADLNGDGQLDMVLGGMKGANVLIHHTKTVSQEKWEAAQPKVYKGEKLPSVENAKPLRGPKPELTADGGHLVGGIEGESLQVETTAGSAKPQPMDRFSGDLWSGNSQLFWTGARPGDTLTIELPTVSGKVTLELILTCARDYGIVQLHVNETAVGAPIDLYNPDVITSGLLTFPGVDLSEGRPTLTIQVVGANPDSQKSYLSGIDCLRIRRADGTYATGE